MFQRFSDAARRSVVTAAEEARALNHDYIGTEHLLLGVLRHDDSAGARLLERFDVPLDWARGRVVEIAGRGDATPSGHMGFTPRAKKVLELSLRESLQRGDNVIGSEHIVVALLREGDGVAAHLLAERGVTLAAARDGLAGIEREHPQDDADDRPGDMVDVGPARRIEIAPEAGLGDGGEPPVP